MMNNNLIAIGVGKYFSLVVPEEIENIEIKKSNITVKVDNKKYDLFRGETFNDSKKLDSLLDKNKEYSIKKHSIQQLIR